MNYLEKSKISLNKSKIKIVSFIAVTSIVLIIYAVYYFIIFIPSFKLPVSIHANGKLEKTETLSLDDLILKIENMMLNDTIIVQRDEKNKLYIEKIDLSEYKIKKKWWNHRAVMDVYFVTDKNELSNLISIYFKYGNISDNSGYTINEISNNISPDF